MMEWWSGLSLVSQIFSAVAIPATIIMILQSLLLLLGFGLDTDIDNDGDMDASGDGMPLISVRGIVAFFSIGGWVGVVSDTAGVPVIFSCLIAFAAGTLALLGVGLLFKNALKLQDSGNLEIGNAVGKTGRVYIPIPPKNAGHGKINVLIQDRYVELEAINEGDSVIKTDELVDILETIDSETVIVRAKNQNSNETKGGISKWI